MQLQAQVSCPKIHARGSFPWWCAAVQVCGDSGGAAAAADRSHVAHRDSLHTFVHAAADVKQAAARRAAAHAYELLQRAEEELPCLVAECMAGQAASRAAKQHLVDAAELRAEAALAGPSDVPVQIAALPALAPSYAAAADGVMGEEHGGNAAPLARYALSRAAVDCIVNPGGQAAEGVTMHECVWRACQMGARVLASYGVRVHERRVADLTRAAAVNADLAAAVAADGAAYAATFAAGAAGRPVAGVGGRDDSDDESDDEDDDSDDGEGGGGGGGGGYNSRGHQAASAIASGAAGNGMSSWPRSTGGVVSCGSSNLSVSEAVPGTVRSSGGPAGGGLPSRSAITRDSAGAKTRQRESEERLWRQVLTWETWWHDAALAPVVHFAEVQGMPHVNNSCGWHSVIVALACALRLTLPTLQAVEALHAAGGGPPALHLAQAALIGTARVGAEPAALRDMVTALRQELRVCAESGSIAACGTPAAEFWCDPESAMVQVPTP
jgi:hypothetical protein